MALIRTVAPTVLPVSLSEFRAHLWNIFDNHNTDALLTSLLEAATDKTETTLGRKLISQTWRNTVRPAAETIVLPFGGYLSLAKASWFDGTAWIDLTAADYDVDDTGVLAEVTCTWPSEATGSVRIDWVCGYGAAATAVPADIRMAIKQLATHWYRIRSASTLEGEDGRVVCTPLTFTNLLHSHRLNFLG